jgi:hypothetical protein
MTALFVFVRAVTYSTLFIGLVLIYLPARFVSWSGLVRPARIEVQQIAGIIIGAAGSVIALWCILIVISIDRSWPSDAQPCSETEPITTYATKYLIPNSCSVGLLCARQFAYRLRYQQQQ